MSNRGGSSSSNGRGNGAAMIPAASKKMVQNLKEIVNCPEHEIYAMLKECNMDPNDTVNRLLSQGCIQPIFPFSFFLFLFDLCVVSYLGFRPVFFGSFAVVQISFMVSFSLSFLYFFLTDP